MSYNCFLNLNSTEWNWKVSWLNESSLEYLLRTLEKKNYRITHFFKSFQACTWSQGSSFWYKLSDTVLNIRYNVIYPGEDLFLHKVMLLFDIWLCEFSKILYVSMTTIMVCCCLLKLQSTIIFTAVSISMTVELRRFESMYYHDAWGDRRKRHHKPQDLYLSRMMKLMKAWKWINLHL